MSEKSDDEIMPTLSIVEPPIDTPPVIEAKKPRRRAPGQKAANQTNAFKDCHQVALYGNQQFTFVLVRGKKTLGRVKKHQIEDDTDYT